MFVAGTMDARGYQQWRSVVNATPNPKLLADLFYIEISRSSNRASYNFRLPNYCFQAQNKKSPKAAE